MQKERNRLIDAAKGLGILLVVFGHSIQFNIGDFNHIAFRFIYSFHMPLFMFLSGCVAKYGDRRSVTKNITRLLLPFLGWYVVTAFVNWGLSGHRPDFAEHFLKLIKAPDNGLWFLWILYWCHVSFYLMALAQRFTGILGAVIVFFLIEYMPGGWLAIPLLRLHFVYFLLGFLAMRYRQPIEQHRNILMPLAALVYFILFPYWQFADIDLISGVIAKAPTFFTDYKDQVIKFYRYLTGISGIATMIALVWYAMKAKPVEWLLTKLGQYTLDIYVSHQFFLGWNFGSALVIRIVTTLIDALAVSLGLAVILKRIPVFRTVLYGVTEEKKAA
jgi:fucose 4-O-acetylase-like acetyltransferase